MLGDGRGRVLFIFTCYESELSLPSPCVRNHWSLAHVAETNNLMIE